MIILLQPQEVLVNGDQEVVVKKEPGAGDVIYRYVGVDQLNDVQNRLLVFRLIGLLIP